MARDEVVDLVDAEDRVVGAATLGECLEKGLLHRAVAVMVSRMDGKVVLQQRSKKDSWHPGMWTLSCTGHVKKGESYATAASRELEEEIGVKADLRLLEKYRVPAMKENGLTEDEWVALFSAKSDDKLTVDPVELEGVREFTLAELRKMLEGDALTPDSVMLIRRFLSHRG
ncbi:MAG: NUDIX domain-containing protein [Nitrososphaerota archaeon]|nr:NUDIX domain-containing protein [Nitrososphaerota archaeon]